MARLLRLGDGRLRLGPPPRPAGDVARRLREPTSRVAEADVAALVELATHLRDQDARHGPTPARVGAIEDAVERGVLSRAEASVLNIDGCVPDRLWEALKPLLA